MTATLEPVQRKTSSDIVFDTLYDQINRLELLPRTKISEAEIAKSFGLSRQPVREAFTRLANLNLLLIRPQRATIVCPFSRSVIEEARFVRAAVELEVVKLAATNRDKSFDAEIRANMKSQAKAISREDASAFHELDYQFHRLMCLSAGKAFAFEIIAANKAQVDRICMLSLTGKDSMLVLYSDHEHMVEAIFQGNADASRSVLRKHLDRLGSTIDEIHQKHSEYFEA